MSDPIAAAIGRHLGPGQMAFDIGANRGHYTRMMAATGARVVAFEPNPDVQDALATGLPPSAEIVRAAVSDTEGAAAFFLDRRPGLDGMASSLLQLDGMDRNLGGGQPATSWSKISLRAVTRCRSAPAMGAGQEMPVTPSDLLARVIAPLLEPI